MTTENADDLEWSIEKNEQLKRERDLCFEDIVEAIQNFGVLADVSNQRAGRSHQGILLVKSNGYVHAVPYVNSKKGKFLKTIYPSRQFNAIYGDVNE